MFDLSRAEPDRKGFVRELTGLFKNEATRRAFRCGFFGLQEAMAGGISSDMPAIARRRDILFAEPFGM
ncbi:hypothetical protein CCR94_15635 [Rhodoblastus sphagnicola]|uniref:Uncharacterized protein n=1 Tax=Rhodoblastus sphagnicola TaxID=333368 RepID=A0A2S6N3P5_9HYPH|nr:hypothetical protein [Rhodoblastus sphagnicola]MBB4198959.1 hypothetical protein [Rhodoblastus sphagnicola]PPQ29244.1 hypothetical protein CCR94_15635 [Rhodoblastus sphagnicola]